MLDNAITKKTISSAFVTVSCLSSILPGQDSNPPPSSLQQIADIPAANDTTVSDRRQQLRDEIAALQTERTLYEARAIYTDRWASSIMTRDWLAYKQYQQESAKYQARVAQTDKKIQELQKELDAIEAQSEAQKASHASFKR